MNGPASGTARVARGMTLSTTCLALSLLAHVYAGGQVHLGAGFVAGALLLSVACVVVAGRRAGWLAIGAVVGLSQLLLHVFAGLSAHHATGHDPLAMPPRMLAAHLVSGAVMTVLLSQGERLVWVLYGLLARLIGPRHDVVLGPSEAPTTRARYAAPERVVTPVVLDAVGERGPPVAPAP